MYTHLIRLIFFLTLTNLVAEARVSRDFYNLNNPDKIILNSSSTYTRLDNQSILLSLSGTQRIQTRMIFSPYVDLEDYDYIELTLTFEEVRGHLNSRALAFTIRDTAPTKTDITLIARSDIKVGEAITIQLPLRNEDDTFEAAQFNEIVLNLYGLRGTIEGRILIADIAAVREIEIPDPTEDPLPEPLPDPEFNPDDISTSLALPSTVITSGETTYALDLVNNTAQINLKGWDNSNIRFRFSPSIDMANATSIAMTVNGTHLSGLISTFQIFFQDHTWSGASRAIEIPQDALLGKNYELIIPIDSLLPGNNFSPATTTDMSLKLLSSGPAEVSITLSNLRLIGGSTPTPTPTPTPGPAPTPVPVPDPTSAAQGRANLVSLNVLEVVLDGNINITEAMKNSTWSLSSMNDANYTGEASPIKIRRFQQALDAEDRNKNGQDTSDLVVRNTFYLHFDRALTNDKTYQLTLKTQLGLPYFYDGTLGGYLSNSYQFGSWNFTAGRGMQFARAIKTNQLGYYAKSQKRYAYLGYWLGDGGKMPLASFYNYEIKNTKDMSRATTGTTTSRGYDTFSGEDVHEIDLSGLSEGQYVIEIPEIGRSAPFRIGGAAFDAYYTTVRGLYHQRSGTALEAQYTPWSRPTAHETAYKVDVLEDWGKFFQANTPKINPITIKAGWHDAGDFDLRPMHMITAEHLMILAEMFPDKFLASPVNIPESGNTLPDPLDEALWGLHLWEILQDDNGGVRAGVESHSHPGSTTADKDPLPYWTYSANRYASYAFAATASHAARLLQRYPSEPGALQRASDLLARAQKAWDWAEAQTSLGTTAPVNNDDADKAKEISRTRLWAAGSLFAATDNIIYQNAYQTEWPANKNPSHFDTIHTLWGMAVATGSKTNLPLRQEVRTRIADSADQFIAYLNQNPYRNSRNPNYNVAWGSAVNTVPYMAPVIMAYHFNPLQKYIDAVAQNADYQLGAHPTAQSWITGLGYFTPEFPLHLDSMYDTKPQPVPGIPVTGAFQASSATGYCDPPNYWQCLVYNAFYPLATSSETNSPTPPARQYSPWARMAPMNEFVVWGDMNYMALAYGFLFATSEEAARDMSALKAADYPLHPGVME